MTRWGRIGLAARWSAGLAGAGLAAVTAVTSLAQPAALELTLSQARQTASLPVKVRAYLDILSADRQPVRETAAADLWATLGEIPLQLERLTPFDSSGEGVAYVFVIDVSRSLSSEQLGTIRGALEVWLSSLGPGDWASLLSFGDESRSLVDFTADPAELLAAAARLQPSGERTVLHLALRDALRLANRRDPGLPGRRVLVVLSDGRDEGSGLTAEDVLAEMRESRTPIYAIGFSQLQEPDRHHYLEVLHRFASKSGGAFFEGERISLAQAYEAIQRTIRRVWIAELDCLHCTADGRLDRLQVHLRQGDRVLSDGIDLRLLPPPPRGGGPETPDADQEGIRAATAAAEDTTSPAEGRSRGLSMGGKVATVAGTIAGLALVIFGLLAVTRRRRIQAAASGEPEELTIPLPPPSRGPQPRRRVPPTSGMIPWAPPVGSGPLPDTLEEPPAPPLRRVRFIVVRGSERGREYDLTFEDRAVVGSGPDCDCELDEPDIAPIQFELFQQAERVMIRNLAPLHPTLVEGHPLEGAQVLRDSNLVGSRSTILRVLLGR